MEGGGRWEVVLLKVGPKIGGRREIGIRGRLASETDGRLVPKLVGDGRLAPKKLRPTKNVAIPTGNVAS